MAQHPEHSAGTEKNDLQIAALSTESERTKDVNAENISDAEQIRKILEKHRSAGVAANAESQEKHAGGNDAFLMFSHSIEQEEMAMRNVPLAEQNAARIAFKQNDIRDMQMEMVSCVDQHVRRPKPTGEQFEKAYSQMTGLMEDFASIDFESEFYEPFGEALMGDPDVRDEKVRELAQGFHDRLDGIAQKWNFPAYDDFSSQKIFNGLTTSDQLDRNTCMAMQQRCVTALEIDKLRGTKISETVNGIARRTDIPAAEKLKKIDAVFSEISKVKTEDPKLKEKVDQLKKENERKEAAQNGTEVKRTEEKIGSQAQKEKVAADIKAKTQVLPETGRALMLEQAENGRQDMILRILTNADPGIALQENGSYAAGLEGETVFLDTDGGMRVFIKAGEEEIPISLTDPNATGFDVARGKKAMIEKGWATVADRTDFILAFVDNPYDDTFLNAQQTKKFQDVARVLFGREGADVEQGLRFIGLTDENGIFQKRYARQLKKTLESWAPEGDVGSLIQSVTPDDIRTLVEMWKKDEKEGATGSLTSYTLANVKEAQASRLN